MEELARRDTKCQSCIIPLTSCQSAPRVSRRREVKLNRVVQVMGGTEENVEYNSLQTLIIIIITHRRSTELPDRFNSHTPAESFTVFVSLLLYLWDKLLKKNVCRCQPNLGYCKFCYLKSPETVGVLSWWFTGIFG